MRFVTILLISASLFEPPHSLAEEVTLRSERLEKSDITVKSEPHLAHISSFERAQNVSLLDNVLTTDECKGLMSYVTSGAIHREYVHKGYDPIDGSEAWDAGSTPWIAVLNKSEVEAFTAWKTAKSLLDTALDKDVRLEHVHGEFLHSLDPKSVVEGWACDPGQYIATIFLTTSWRHNDYGQISFYSRTRNPNVSSEQRLETVRTVHPKRGRMVIWPHCIPHLFHPPSVNYKENLITVNMWFSIEDKPKEEMDKVFNKFTKMVPKQFSRLSEFTFTSPDADRKIDYKKHLKRTFHDSSKRPIYVFDDLYTDEELKDMKDLLLNIGTTFVNKYDGDSIEDHDNVQWIKMFNISEFLETPIWKRVHDLATYVSGEDEWYPYDVALNHVRSSDHTRIHPDASLHEVEYTYLVYLTEGLGPDEMGETVWFEQRKKSHDGIHMFTGPGGEEFEPIAAVRPKYGRVVIFRNVIEHSARPPGTQFHGCRYSFAVKVSRTKRIAISKQIYEVMEGFGNEEMDEEMAALESELHQGLHDEESGSNLTTEQLDEKLHKFRATVLNEMKAKHYELLQQLQGLDSSSKPT